MSDSFSALGYNPAPGHPRLATNLANHLGSTASTLQETQRLLDGLDKQSSFWTGDAATKFTEQIHDLPDSSRCWRPSRSASAWPPSLCT